MKIDLTKTFINLDNEPMKKHEKTNELLELGEALAEIVIAPKPQGSHVKWFSPLKAIELARELKGELVIDIDKADFAQLKEVVDANGTYRPIVTGQIMEMLESVKDESKKEIKEDK